MHDLRCGEPLSQKVVPVLGGSLANPRVWRESEAQLVDQFIQEHGYSVIDPHFGGRWSSRPSRRLRPASADDLFAIYGHKLMQHDTSSHAYRTQRTDSRGVQDSTG